MWFGCVCASVRLQIGSWYSLVTVRFASSHGNYNICARSRADVHYARAYTYAFLESASARSSTTANFEGHFIQLILEHYLVYWLIEKSVSTVAKSLWWRLEM